MMEPSPGWKALAGQLVRKVASYRRHFTTADIWAELPRPAGFSEREAQEALRGVIGAAIQEGVMGETVRDTFYSKRFGAGWSGK